VAGWRRGHRRARCRERGPATGCDAGLPGG
jgi:hypothetical protein